MRPSPPLDRTGFEIALICALPLEADCVQAIFDGFWEDEGKDYGKASGDLNSYSTGTIEEHNVVLAYLPGMGKVSAASVASSLRISFPSIKLAFVVGICGGAPYIQNQSEILLGDVIVSQSVVQYDFGRQYPTAFERKDTLEHNLARPNPEIRSLLAKSQTHRYRKRLQEDIMVHFEQLQEEMPTVQCPDASTDRLYEPTYAHKHHRPGCQTWSVETRGPIDEAILDCYSNLALALSNPHQLEEAEFWAMRAVHGRQQRLGNRHVKTLASMEGLIYIYNQQGRVAEAASLGINVMEISEQVLRRGHPQTMNTARSLVYAFMRSGKWEEAEGLCLQSVEILKTMQRPGARLLLNHFSDLAKIRLYQKRFEESEKIYKEVLRRFTVLWGSQHPDTLLTMGYLSDVKWQSGQRQEAIDLMTEIVRLSPACYRSDHPQTLRWEQRLSSYIAARNQGSSRNQADVQSQPFAQDTLPIVMDES